MKSLLDNFYSTVFNRDLFFKSGWGEMSGLNYILASDPNKLHLRPVRDISIQWESGKTEKGIHIRNGFFESPFVFEYTNGKNKVLVELPDEAKRAYVQFILPNQVDSNTPVVIHFAATGDEGFSRRRLTMAIPLAKIGIGSLLLENPFYGKRRPVGQKGVMIERFTEFLRMSRAATDEGIAILRYLKNKGHNILGVTGISMGGYVAVTAAARSEFELAVAACIPSHSGSPVYTDGLLSKVCDWNSLQNELVGTKKDARIFMREILDCSDIRTFPKPKRPDAVVIVGAKNDAYIPQYSTEIIKEHLPEATLRWVSQGHVGSFLFCAKDFRNAVKDSFDLLTHVTK
ncbi:MAG: alpha/beta hydrolase family protein [Leptospiraceae bacterium]|nr:alpha/beta hydrolase family protein [Leptospiraceae bacterium]